MRIILITYGFARYHHALSIADSLQISPRIVFCENAVITRELAARDGLV